MRSIWSACAIAAALAAGGPAAAQSWGLYLEGGRAPHSELHTDMATIGLRVPTQVAFLDGSLRLSVDAYLSRWHAKALPGERDHFLQVGIVPMLRWRPDGGRSPWFVEGGIGASYLTHGYRTAVKAFGSRWNFSDHLGVGLGFGAQRRHELGLYVKHVSNAGLSKPNPGETFWVLRYSYAL